MQIGECQIWEENHEHGSETGPYGSVRAHIHTGWIPQALGSLWDASRASKRHWKITKKPGFPDFGGVLEAGRHPRGFPEPVGSILVEYEPEPSHMDLIRTSFHAFWKFWHSCI